MGAGAKIQPLDLRFVGSGVKIQPLDLRLVGVGAIMISMIKIMIMIL